MVLVLPEAGSAQQALGIVHWFLKLPPQRATGVRIDFPCEKQGKSPGMGGLAESNRADGGPVTNVDDADFAVGLSEVNLISLYNGIGKRARNGSHGGAVYGVDDFCGGFFKFDCVAHSSNCVGLI